MHPHRHQGKYSVSQLDHLPQGISFILHLELLYQNSSMQKNSSVYSSYLNTRFDTMEESFKGEQIQLNHIPAPHNTPRPQPQSLPQLQPKLKQKQKQKPELQSQSKPKFQIIQNAQLSLQQPQRQKQDLNMAMCQGCGLRGTSVREMKLSYVNWIWCVVMSLSGFGCVALCVDVWKKSVEKCSECGQVRRVVDPQSW